MSKKPFCKSAKQAKIQIPAMNAKRFSTATPAKTMSKPCMRVCRREKRTGDLNSNENLAFFVNFSEFLALFGWLSVFEFYLTMQLNALILACLSLVFCR